MRRFYASALIGLSALSLASVARANTYNFTFDDGKIAGTFTTIAASGDEQLIVGVSGIDRGSNITRLTPPDEFGHDNLLFPNFDAPDDKGYFLNGFEIFTDGIPPINFDDFSFAAGGGGLAFDYPQLVFGYFTVTEVSAAPEPYAWSLLLAGVAMIGATLRFGRRQRALSA